MIDLHIVTLALLVRSDSAYACRRKVHDEKSRTKKVCRAAVSIKIQDCNKTSEVVGHTLYRSYNTHSSSITSALLATLNRVGVRKSQPVYLTSHTCGGVQGPNLKLEGSDWDESDLFAFRPHIG